MQRPNQAHLRINLAELKAQLAKGLGPDRSKLYFCCLNKLLSLKLSKVEFDKFCLRVIGRENVKLHNKLICSILRNACKAKAAPSTSTHDGNGLEITCGGYEHNGDVLLSSPWGARSGVSIGSDREFSSHQSTITSNNVVVENGDLDCREIRKLVQHQQILSKETNNEGEVVCHHPAEINVSADGLISVDSSQQSVLSVGEGNEPFTRCSLQPPLGLPFCLHSVGGARQASHVVRGDRCCSLYDIGGLLDTKTLKERMQEIAVARGLEGVSMNCANLLNNGLDVYLKRLIRSSIQLVGIRSGHDLVENTICKHHSLVHLVNDGFPGYYNFPVQSSSRPLEGMQGKGYGFQLSLLDFKVAMGLKPQQLGEDWPLLLERICTCSNDE